jgi:hypothetical protein
MKVDEGPTGGVKGGVHSDASAGSLAPCSAAPPPVRQKQADKAEERIVGIW